MNFYVYKFVVLYSDVHMNWKTYIDKIIIMFIDCKWVDTRWQWSFNMLYMHGL